MKHLLLLWMVGLSTACAHGPRWLRLQPKPDPAIDSLYWRAVYHLDAANRQGSLDSAVVMLDTYVASGTEQTHRTEAIVLRQLARDAQHLAKVQSALLVARAAPAAPTDTVTVAIRVPEPRARNEEALREIQRLKDELAKANAELERIRKRLTNPREPPTQP